MFQEQAEEQRVNEAFPMILPTYQLQAMYFNANRREGARAMTAIDMMPPSWVPAELRDPNQGQARYSPEFVAAFELAMDLRVVDNGLLAALGTMDLRASGAEF